MFNASLQENDTVGKGQVEGLTRGEICAVEPWVSLRLRPPDTVNPLASSHGRLVYVCTTTYREVLNS